MTLEEGARGEGSATGTEDHLGGCEIDALIDGSHGGEKPKLRP